jgi:hypothetical protein
VSCEGVTSLGVVFLNVRKEIRKGREEVFGTGARLLGAFLLEASLPVGEGIALGLVGW